MTNAGWIPTWLQEFEKEAGYSTMMEKDNSVSWFVLQTVTKQPSEQEKIRGGLLKIIDEDIRKPMTAVNFIEAILQFLHSQGVVMKGQSLGGSHPHLAAYYTVESIITEEHTHKGTDGKPYIVGESGVGSAQSY